MTDDPYTNRRNVLKTIGGAFAGISILGTGTASANNHELERDGNDRGGGYGGPVRTTTKDTYAGTYERRGREELKYRVEASIDHPIWMEGRNPDIGIVLGGTISTTRNRYGGAPGYELRHYRSELTGEAPDGSSFRFDSKTYHDTETGRREPHPAVVAAADEIWAAALPIPAPPLSLLKAVADHHLDDGEVRREQDKVVVDRGWDPKVVTTIPGVTGWMQSPDDDGFASGLYVGADLDGYGGRNQDGTFSLEYTAELDLIRVFDKYAPAGYSVEDEIELTVPFEIDLIHDPFVPG